MVILGGAREPRKAMIFCQPGVVAVLVALSVAVAAVVVVQAEVLEESEEREEVPMTTRVANSARASMARSTLNG